jgi:hypothetical protein
VAEHREPSQLIGDFLREVAVLVLVFWPLEKWIQDRKIDGSILLFAILVAGMLMYWGIILEGRDEL